MRSDSKPWYKQFWPWFLIAIPMSSVIMGITMITLAMDGKDSLVREDWYKDGIAINKRLDKQNRAQSLGIKAFISVDESKNALHIAMVNLDLQRERELTLHLIHPTLKNLDRTLKLVLTPQDTFYARLPELPSGRYYVQLTTPAQVWEIDSSLNFSNHINKLELVPNG